MHKWHKWLGSALLLEDMMDMATVVLPKLRENKTRVRKKQDCLVALACLLRDDND